MCLVKPHHYDMTNGPEFFQQASQILLPIRTLYTWQRFSSPLQMELQLVVLLTQMR